MVNQGALDPTKMCADGWIVGASVKVPRVTWTKVPSRTTEYSSEPHFAQRASWLSS
jgi:hypothetical protein